MEASWPDAEVSEDQLGEVLEKAQRTTRSSFRSPEQNKNPKKHDRSSSTGVAAPTKSAVCSGGKRSTSSPTPTTVTNGSGDSSQSAHSDTNAVTASFPNDDSHKDRPSQPASERSQASCSNVKSKASKTASAREQRSKRRQAHLENNQQAKKKVKPTKTKEHAVRIPMRTGTLIMYRGSRRRAEFVFKV